MKAISPNEVGSVQAMEIPDDVIAVWNEFIARRYDRGTAVIKQDDIVQALAVRMVCERARIFDAGWLNIEPLFEAQGWRVDYWKPDYTERGPATFTFTPRTRRE